MNANTDNANQLIHRLSKTFNSQRTMALFGRWQAVTGRTYQLDFCDTCAHLYVNASNINLVLDAQTCENLHVIARVNRDHPRLLRSCNFF